MDSGAASDRAARHAHQARTATARQNGAQIARSSDDGDAALSSTPRQEYTATKLITVSAGEHAARAQLAWAEESLAMLAGLPD